MKPSVILRFVVIGTLWLMVCAWFVVRQRAAGVELNMLTLFPLLASGIIVFVPLYKKYVRNDRKRGNNK